MLFFSAVGILNGLIWTVLFWLWPRRNTQTADRLLGFLIMALVIRIAKSVALLWSALPFWIIHLGLTAFMSVGPLLMLYVAYSTQGNPRRFFKPVAHFVPVFLHLVASLLVPWPKAHRIWEFRYGLIITWVLIYIVWTTVKYPSQIFRFKGFRTEHVKGAWITVALFWLFYTVHWLSPLFPYGTSALVFCLYTYYILLITVRNRWKKASPIFVPHEVTQRRNSIYDRLIQYLNRKDVFSDSLLSLPKVAHALSVQPHELSAAIKQKEHTGFPELIMTIRLHHIAQKLTDPKNEETMASLAFSHGFNSLSTFNTAFRKQFRQTPTQYKKKHRTV